VLSFCPRESSVKNEKHSTRPEDIASKVWETESCQMDVNAVKTKSASLRAPEARTLDDFILPLYSTCSP